MGDGIEGEASMWATASVSRLARGKGVDKGGGGHQEQRASRGASHVPVKYRDLAQVLGIGDDWAWVNAWGTQRTAGMLWWKCTEIAKEGENQNIKVVNTPVC